MTETETRSRRCNFLLSRRDREGFKGVGESVDPAPPTGRAFAKYCNETRPRRHVGASRYRLDTETLRPRPHIPVISMTDHRKTSYKQEVNHQKTVATLSQIHAVYNEELSYMHHSDTSFTQNKCTNRICQQWQTE